MFEINTKNNDKQINYPGVNEPMFTKPQNNNHHQADKLFYLALIATNVAVQFNRFSQLKLTFIGGKKQFWPCYGRILLSADNFMQLLCCVFAKFGLV